VGRGKIGKGVHLVRKKIGQRATQRGEAGREESEQQKGEIEEEPVKGSVGLEE